MIVVVLGQKLGEARKRVLMHDERIVYKGFISAIEEFPNCEKLVVDYYKGTLIFDGKMFAFVGDIEFIYEEISGG